MNQPRGAGCTPGESAVTVASDAPLSAEAVGAALDEAGTTGSPGKPRGQERRFSWSRHRPFGMVLIIPNGPW
jgi:hypothetical protein